MQQDAEVNFINLSQEKKEDIRGFSAIDPVM
jgi:hypothetical protein